MRTLVQMIASAVDARLSCIERSKKVKDPHEKVHWDEMEQMHKQTLEKLCNYLPSGSGWDDGTQIELCGSSGERLVLFGAFHHMSQDGCYDGWSSHGIIVTPSLRFGFNVRVTGRDRNDIKEYLDEMFTEALEQMVPDLQDEMNAQDMGMRDAGMEV